MAALAGYTPPAPPKPSGASAPSGTGQFLNMTGSGTNPITPVGNTGSYVVGGTQPTYMTANKSVPSPASTGVFNTNGVNKSSVSSTVVATNPITGATTDIILPTSTPAPVSTGASNLIVNKVVGGGQTSGGGGGGQTNTTNTGGGTNESVSNATGNVTNATVVEPTSAPTPIGGGQNLVVQGNYQPAPSTIPPSGLPLTGGGMLYDSALSADIQQYELEHGIAPIFVGVPANIRVNPYTTPEALALGELELPAGTVVTKTKEVPKLYS
jgi:hypothetical protein